MTLQARAVPSTPRASDKRNKPALLATCPNQTRISRIFPASHHL